MCAGVPCGQVGGFCCSPLDGRLLRSRADWVLLGPHTHTQGRHTLTVVLLLTPTPPRRAFYDPTLRENTDRPSSRPVRPRLVGRRGSVPGAPDPPSWVPSTFPLPRNACTRLLSCLNIDHHPPVQTCSTRTPVRMCTGRSSGRQSSHTAHLQM